MIVLAGPAGGEVVAWANDAMRMTPTVAISALLATFAVGDGHAASSGVEPLVKELLQNGKVIPWDSGVSSQLGLEREVVPVVAFRLLRSTPTAVDRQFFIVLKSSEVRKPVALVLTRSENADTKDERMWFYATDPEGSLKRAVTVDYSALVEPEITSSETKRHFNAEWTFWKDMAKKRKKSKPAAPKP